MDACSTNMVCGHHRLYSDQTGTRRTLFLLISISSLVASVTQSPFLQFILIRPREPIASHPIHRVIVADVAGGTS